MANLSISRAWDETKGILARDGKLFVAVAAALLVLPQTLLGAFVPAIPAQVSTTFQLLFLLVIITAIAAQIALNRLAIPPSATVAAGLGRGLTRTPATLVALVVVFLFVFVLFVILAALLVAAGAVEAPTPGQAPAASLAAILVVLFLGVFAIFQLIMPISAVERGGPFRLIRRCWELSRYHYLRLLVFIIAVFVVMFFLWIITQLIMGLTFTAILGPPQSGSIGLALISLVVATVQGGWTIVTSVMLARIYLQVSGNASAEFEVPISGT